MQRKLLKFAFPTVQYVVLLSSSATRYGWIEKTIFVLSFLAPFFESSVFVYQNTRNTTWYSARIRFGCASIKRILIYYVQRPEDRPYVVCIGNWRTVVVLRRAGNISWFLLVTRCKANFIVRRIKCYRVGSIMVAIFVRQLVFVSVRRLVFIIFSRSPATLITRNDN